MFVSELDRDMFRTEQDGNVIFLNSVGEVKLRLKMKKGFEN